MVAVEPAGAKPVTAKTAALLQSLMMAGVPAASRAELGSRSTGMSAVLPKIALVRKVGVPGRAVCRTSMSLPVAGVGLVAGMAASSAGLQAPAVASNPYTGCRKFHIRVAEVSPLLTLLVDGMVEVSVNGWVQPM